MRVGTDVSRGWEEGLAFARSYLSGTDFWCEGVWGRKTPAYDAGFCDSYCLLHRGAAFSSCSAWLRALLLC